MSSATLSISYSFVGEACSGLLLEIPEGDFAYGDQIPIRLWGVFPEDLDRFALQVGTSVLGLGTVHTADTVQIETVIKLAESIDKGQFKYPVSNIVSATAVSELFYIEDDQVVSWATRGQDLTSLIRQDGYSCARLDTTRELFGNVRVVGTKTIFYKEWLWTLPQGSLGEIWFFLLEDGRIRNKFAVEVPEMATTALEYRNILLRVQDFSTEVPLADAQVFLDGESKGSTDVDGLLRIDEVRTGTHAIRVVKQGYYDTDQDLLSNDSITVY